MGIGEVRPEVDGTTEVKLGLGQPIELDQGPRQVVVGLGVVGVGLQDLLEDGGGDGGLAAAARLDATHEEHPLAHAQRVETSREWIGKGDRLLLALRQLRSGPLQVAERSVGHPQVVVRDASRGLIRKRRLEVRSGRSGVIARRGDATETEARGGARGLALESRGEGALRLLHVAGPQVEVSGAQERRHVSGPQGKSGLDARLRFLQVAVADVEDRLVVGPAEIGRLETQNPAQARLGGLHQLVAQVQEAEVAQRFDRLAATRSIGQHLLDVRTARLELIADRRLEIVESGDWNAAEIRQHGAGLGHRGAWLGVGRRLAPGSSGGEGEQEL